ncbi:hypothetical protein GCM10025865_22580 [Paraoerskovia sediminicola]|uniref:ATP synthase protein I n=1 Tax=Paraoerskovia sediminicola TaxID=1138587 RepID=A0ABM8G4K1_9CELL|nr:hypothetical protein [Paraoerskovia sediminicola]BDZ42959.1 hypothetical protein GCM10025865_22580 [Paraoerskovia sediminicola]
MGDATNDDDRTQERSAPGPAGDGPTAGSGPAGQPDARGSGDVFRVALRDVVVMLICLAIVGVGVGVLVDGARGAWGALLGVAIALVFSGTTVWAMHRTAGSSATTMAAVVMGSWIAKMVVVVAALVVLRGMDFYNTYVFAAVLLVGTIGSAFVDYRAVDRSRVPYVEPGSRDGAP